MSSLDSLPPDQRAVLQLVLQRGRSYDDIASLLSIDRAAVRQRALDGFDALGPSTSIPAPQRALLTDYLLGQLPPKVAEQVRERLGSSPPDRAWTRVIASEVASLASRPLPEIPVGSTRRGAAAAPAGAERAGATAGLATATESETEGGRAAADDGERQPGDRPSLERPRPAPRRAVRQPPPSEPLSAAPRSSRRGGAILLGGLAAAIVIAIIVVLLVSGGGGKRHRAAQGHARTGTGVTPTTSSTSTTAKGPAKLLTQINLKPVTAGSKAAGVVFVVREGSTVGVVIKASGVPANARNAYAVWLAGPGGTAKRVGFVGARVASDGQLETQGALPPNANQFRQILIVLETPSQTQSSKLQGQVVLQGPFSER